MSAKCTKGIERAAFYYPPGFNISFDANFDSYFTVNRNSAFDGIKGTKVFYMSRG